VMALLPVAATFQVLQIAAASLHVGNP
jgi:hypothetical protein